MSSQIRRLSTLDANFAEQFRALLAYEEQRDPHVEGAVADIIHAVRKRGDEALLEFTEKFDRVKANSAADLEIGQDELKHAFDTLDPDQKAALKVAAQRVRAFHERQVAESWEFTEADGTRLGQRVTPLDRAGLYVPGGKAAYPSSVLMNAVPAKVAGVKEVIMVVPTPSGVKNQMVLAAAAVNGDLQKGSEVAQSATIYNHDLHRKNAESFAKGIADACRQMPGYCAPGAENVTEQQMVQALEATARHGQGREKVDPAALQLVSQFLNQFESTKDTLFTPTESESHRLGVEAEAELALAIISLGSAAKAVASKTPGWLEKLAGMLQSGEKNGAKDLTTNLSEVWTLKPTQRGVDMSHTLLKLSIHRRAAGIT